MLALQLITNKELSMAITVPLSQVLEDAATAARAEFSLADHGITVDVDGVFINIGAISDTQVDIQVNRNSVSELIEFKTDYDIHSSVRDFLTTADSYMLSLMYSDAGDAPSFIPASTIQVVTKYQYNKTPVANAWTRDALKDDKTLNHDIGEELNPTIVNVDIDSEEGIGVTGELVMRKMNPTVSSDITGEIERDGNRVMERNDTDTV